MSIEIKNLKHIYMPRTPYERLALDDVNLTIPQGKITAIAGHTGSGKSTLIQHFNGLLEPAEGQVLVDGVSVTGKKPENKKARRSVGMVFQYPEHQLFEENQRQVLHRNPKAYKNLSLFPPANSICKNRKIIHREKQ